MALLNYLPDIAQQFGLTGAIGGAILKPRLQLPIEKEHSHEHVKKILKKAETKYGRNEPYPGEFDTTVLPTTEMETKAKKEKPEAPVVITSKPAPKTQIPVEPEPVSKQTIEPDDRYPETLPEEDPKPVVAVDTMKPSRSPFAFTIIMGLAGGVLVIMLFIIIAMVMRRRRNHE